MKLSFSTLGDPNLSLEGALELAKRFSLDGVEIRGLGGQLDNRKIEAFQKAALRETRNKLEQYGMTIPVLGTSCAFHSEANRQAALEEGKGALEICGELGIPYLRVFGDALGGDWEDGVSRVSRGIEKLCQLAEGYPVEILLEVHGDFNTLETVGSVLDALEHCSQFGILWDLEHSDRVYGDSWEPFYRRIASKVKHVHIKDALRKQDPERTTDLVLPGRGDVPIKQIVQRLEEDGYAGYYSLEWEKHWAPQLEPLETALECFVDEMKNADCC